jgi:hypothetical protein
MPTLSSVYTKFDEWSRNLKATFLACSVPSRAPVRMRNPMTKTDAILKASADLETWIESFSAYTAGYAYPDGMTREEAKAAVGHDEELHCPGGHDEDYLSQLFTPSELDLYGFALDHKWSATELADMIEMLHKEEFNADDVDTNLHVRFQNLVQVCV